ncbi:velvet factor [Armillaria luteobubalina]|uniref:Velvet factor n=1 Tax=Armillaria luteobubalina TaxID=153913 RepID=A0AA39UZS0_9AGAR|nr:velvet factor [Armillaria luteobubalina]
MPAKAVVNAFSELTWARWSGRRLYTLEVVQNPLRARTCGFGDKDRRPLAPAAVVKMVVKREDDSTVDVDEVDCSFFLITVDLWSEDGKQEMNLVLHPSLAERYVQQTSRPCNNNKRRRVSKSGHSLYPASDPDSSPTDLVCSGPTSAWCYLCTPFLQSPQQPPQSFDEEPWKFDPNNSEWNLDAYSNPNLPPDPSSSPSDDVYREPTTPAPTSPSIGKRKRPLSTPVIPPLPRHTYTRTLVGPLSANATRLLDAHRKPGIFFLFQDLSVRTEGTFRLRLRLMNVGAPPAPEAGASAVHTAMSPVLAQTFTEPFTVFAAKKFPGVPDMTVLSIALGNQGQKLPLVRISI